jgi:hypothetical protein
MDGEFASIHEAAFDGFVRSRAGRETYTLHYNAEVPLCQDASAITRVQRLAIMRLGKHYRERERKNARSSAPSMSSVSKPSGL